uniref:Bromo domain-containing protein n=1 Tax=Arcella intermedia TaxID=1963864 RepID=A0A6B2L308_9EUKA
MKERAARREQLSSKLVISLPWEAIHSQKEWMKSCDASRRESKPAPLVVSIPSKKRASSTQKPPEASKAPEKKRRTSAPAPKPAPPPKAPPKSAPKPSKSRRPSTKADPDSLPPSAPPRGEYRPLEEVLTHLLTQLMDLDTNNFFYHPVTDLQAPDYSNIIKHPMCFSVMEEKLESGEYSCLEMFVKDFKLISDNCMQYNETYSPYHKAARELWRDGSGLVKEYELQISPDLLKIPATYELKRYEEEEIPKNKEKLPDKVRLIPDVVPSQESILFNPKSEFLTDIISSARYKKEHIPLINSRFQPPVIVQKKVFCNETNYHESITRFLAPMGSILKERVGLFCELSRNPQLINQIQEISEMPHSDINQEEYAELMTVKDFQFRELVQSIYSTPGAGYGRRFQGEEQEMEEMDGNLGEGKENEEEEEEMATGDQEPADSEDQEGEEQNEDLSEESSDPKEQPDSFHNHPL